MQVEISQGDLSSMLPLEMHSHFEMRNILNARSSRKYEHDVLHAAFYHLFGQQHFQFRCGYEGLRCVKLKLHILIFLVRHHWQRPRL